MNEEQKKNQEKKSLNEAALQEKDEKEKDSTKEESSSGKQLFLFYRTPSNKDNKKVLFKDK